MKRAYVKPYLAVESFQLDASIAGSCSGKLMLSHGVDTCSLTDDKGLNYGDARFGAACGENYMTQPDSCYQAMAYNFGFLES